MGSSGRVWEPSFSTPGSLRPAFSTAVVIAAIDEASGAQLWAVQLYETVFDANEERDVQEVYVNSLRIDSKNGSLIATDELKRRWQIRLTDGHVTQLPAAESRK